MNFFSLRSTLSLIAATIGAVFVVDSAEAQFVRYYRPATNFNGYYQAPVPSQRTYAAPATRSYSSPRPATGYGSNLHRNFVIRQEQQRSARTGQRPRNRGNILWAR